MREVYRRGKRKKKKKVFSKDEGKSRRGIYITIMIIYVLLMICFSAMLIWLNVVPMKYLIPALVLIVVASFFIVMFLLIKKKKSKRRMAGVIVAVIAIAVYGVGSFYIYSTQDLFAKISTIGKSTEDYYVIVRADDKERNSVGDILGDDVYVFKSEEEPYVEAKDRLKKHVEVNFEEEKNTFDVAKKLDKKECQVALMSSTHYNMACENMKQFDENTKTIYTITVESEVDDVTKSVGKITTTPFNVMISGNDTFGSIDQVAKSDVNMVMTVNPNTKTILLTSMPRDTYFPLHSKQALDKLTHSGVYGVDETVTTVEDLLGIDLNYYIRVNFTTVIKIIDAIGGIDVNSDSAFITHGRQNEGYSFVEGKNHIGGEEALAFSRERKSFGDGDFQRNRNQQKVLRAMLKKVLTSETLLTKYTQLLDAVKDEMQTNMSTGEMQSLVKMQIEDMTKWKIITYPVEGTPGSEPCYTLGGVNASIVYPSTSSVNKANAKINNVIKGAPQADGEWTLEYE